MVKSTTAHFKSKIYSTKDLEDASNLIQQCIRWNPKDRISAKDALNH